MPGGQVAVTERQRQIELLQKENELLSEQVSHLYSLNDITHRLAETRAERIAELQAAISELMAGGSPDESKARD
jgi:hypothetical protein